MADFRKHMPDRLVQIQRRALFSLGDLAQAAITNVDAAVVMDAQAVGVAAALERAASEIRAVVARAQAEDQEHG